MRNMRKFSLKKIEGLPTLRQGQTDDLKVETKNTRVWLSRMTVEDGMEYNNQVTEERYWCPQTSGGVDQAKSKTWQTARQYQAI